MFLIIYSLSFYIMFILIARAMKGVPLSSYSEAFYMIAAFSLCKASAPTIEIVSNAVTLPVGAVFTGSLSSMISVIGNVFLFQAALALLMFNSSAKIKFRVVPVILFAGYLLLYISGVIEAGEVDRLGRISFGYNSGIITAIAMFNIYFIRKEKSIGLLLGGAGFIVYGIFEGIIFSPLLGISPSIFRMSAAVILMTSAFFLTMLREERKLVKNIGYV